MDGYIFFHPVTTRWILSSLSLTVLCVRDDYLTSPLAAARGEREGNGFLSLADLIQLWLWLKAWLGHMERNGDERCACSMGRMGGRAKEVEKEREGRVQGQMDGWIPPFLWLYSLLIEDLGVFVSPASHSITSHCRLWSSLYIIMFCFAFLLFSWSRSGFLFVVSLLIIVCL
ncbi:hypothetical protein B0T24DRAFT_609224 [Lasiosphaeria ovina]|uniref:Uncharacterized protein n=1 Tax=Lasiosphaeria ovina TaxID=92902 RepID=A0AAE0TZ13_9PEZI|nr:hypothetical protein B0T24DRAFT_609224 [Lasiosphaeria ovina]